MNPDRRKTPRLSLHLTLEVNGRDSKGLRFHETSKLINISGGGAQFITSSAEHYFEGQQLQALVHIPGTKDVSGNMNTIATVLRLDREATGGAQLSLDQKTVSVHFLKPLSLQRT